MRSITSGHQKVLLNSCQHIYINMLELKPQSYTENGWRKNLYFIQNGAILKFCSRLGTKTMKRGTLQEIVYHHIPCNDL